MATIGQTLTSPEAGWRRYDDTDSRIKYNGTWIVATNAQFYGGTGRTSSTIGDNISFKFYGTKLRIISNADTTRATNIILQIDGTGYTYSQNYVATTQCLVCEIVGLSLGNHSVTIIVPSPQVTGTVVLDAIDIDDTGYLVHPILNEVHKINYTMNIGDCIPCRYTATTSGQLGYFSELGKTVSTLIPTTSTATPDGSFYWVYIGKDYLDRKKFIADRVIQHNISCDTLNSEGICGEKSISDNLYNYVPILSGDTNSPSPYIVTYSSFNAGGSAYGYKAFNRTNLNSWDCWHSESSNTNEWLKINLGTNKKICSSYSITSRNDPTYLQTPKSWRLEGSNDDISWSILDTQTLQDVSWAYNTTKSYKITNNIDYKYYRIFFTEKTNQVAIGKLELFEKCIIDKNINTSIRLLTGGIATTDTDNEWDKIIVNSTLNNIITAGDNNIWNWTGIESWTSTTATTSANRITRGKLSASNTTAPTGVVSSYISSADGFRPVLLVEPILTTKYLIKKDLNYYTVKSEHYDEVSHSFEPLSLNGGTTPNKTDINVFGFDTLEVLTNSITVGSDTFKPIDKIDNTAELKMYKPI